MKNIILTMLLWYSGSVLFAQALYTPSGTVGTSTNGNVGVGVSAPESKFHVQNANLGVKTQYGVGIFESKDAHLDLISSSDASWGSFINLIEGAGSTSNTDIWSIARETTLGDGSSKFAIKYGTNINTTSNPNLLTITPSGRVGLGTSTPGSALDVHSTASGTALRLLGSNLDLDLLIGHVGDSYGYYWRYKGTQNGDNDLELWSQNQQGADILIYRAHQDGKMGFHQAVAFGDLDVPSGYRVAIDGKVLMEEVKVQVIDPPDYVFADTYPLLTLEATEKYIQENRHLPDVPSAEEMVSAGVELGEMNMLLLKKIEELTLHQIDLLKMVREQQEQITELSNKIQSHEN